MGVSVVSFDAELLPAVRGLMDDAFTRPRDERYHRWALLGDPGHRAWVAVDGARCVAILRAFARPYRLGGRPTTCLETFDWYASPEARRSAAGLLVMKAAMDEPEPLVNVGGTRDSLALLPRLGWRAIDEAVSYVLPLAGGALSRDRAARLGPLAPAGRAAVGVAGRAWFGRARGAVPAQGRVEELTEPADEVVVLAEGDEHHATMPLPDPGHLRWLTEGAPAVGRFRSVLFRVAGRPAGWGMTRVNDGPDGREASLVEVYAPRPEPALLRWMVAELVDLVRPERPVQVRAQTTSPVLAQALGGQRFVRAHRRPVQVWTADGLARPTPAHFTMTTQDFPLLPYGERWVPRPPADPEARQTMEDARVR
jgi:hypothetical protein